MGFLPNINPPPNPLPSIGGGYSFLPNVLGPAQGLPSLAPPSGGLPSLGGSGSFLPSLPSFPSFGGAGGGMSLPSFALPHIGLPSLSFPPMSLYDSSQHPAPVQQPGTTPTPGGTTLSTPAGPTHASPYMAQINQVSQETGVPADVLAAIIDTENSGPNSVSPAGANGIMQVVGGPMDVLGSIRAGAAVLKQKMAANGYAPDDWDHTAGAYFGFGTDVGGMTTNNYIARFHAARAAYAAPAPATSAGPAPVAPGGDLRPSQFSLGLDYASAYAACGPASAIALARATGGNPDTATTMQYAKLAGWTTTQGMSGPSSEVQLLRNLGVTNASSAPVDWAHISALAAAGTPLLLSSPGHYFFVTGFNPQTGTYHVGSSGTDLRGGSTDMTPRDMQRLMGTITDYITAG